MSLRLKSPPQRVREIWYCISKLNKLIECPEASTNAIHPKDWRATHIIIQSPSMPDQEEEIQTWSELKTKAENFLNETREAMEIGMASETRMQHLPIQTDRLALANAQLKKMKSHDLGHVFASSGFKIAKRGCALDWALIEVDDPSTVNNVVSSSSS